MIFFENAREASIACNLLQLVCRVDPTYSFGVVGDHGRWHVEAWYRVGPPDSGRYLSWGFISSDEDCREFLADHLNIR